MAARVRHFLKVIGVESASSRVEREVGSPVSYPAAIQGVITVGAVKVGDKVVGFSNRNNHTSICAPCVGVWSTLPTTPGQLGFRADSPSPRRLV